MRRQVKVKEPLPKGMTDAEITARIGTTEARVEGGTVVAARASADRRWILMTVEYERGT